MKDILFLLLFIPVVSSLSAQNTVAFKGAEGYGATAKGGSKENVYHVTNLNDSGTGSFRDAVSDSGRTIVFDVEGTINLKSRINACSNLTIKGQTAPGKGITLYGQTVAFNKIHDVIVQYLRLHGSINMSRGSCVLNADSSDKIIFDHLSVTWGRWDDLHIKGSSNITLQYCIIGESIDPQRFGALLENPVNLTVHHCLWIDNQSRNPKAKAKIQLINNVVYNWGGSGLVGGHSAENHYQDVINNYFIAGPSSSNNFLAMFTKTDHVYQKGNYVDNNKDGKLNGRAVTFNDFVTDKKDADIIDKGTCSPSVSVTQESASDAYYNILKNAGCSKVRDETDLRLIEQLSSLGEKGEIIHSEKR